MHQQGLIPVLVGDRVFEEGYDNPQERIGFFVRPSSLQNTVGCKQSRGRLLRKAEGKDFALIFDWSYNGLSQLLNERFIWWKEVD